MVERLEDYPWSSFAAYVAKTATPQWLHRDMVYSMLGGKVKRYQAFVAQGVDGDLAQFYHGKSVCPILGDEGFKQRMIERYQTDDPEIAERNRIGEPASLDKIVAAVARTMERDQRQIYESVRGRQNPARILVADFAYRSGQMDYREIAEAPGMNHHSAVASCIRRLKILCQKIMHMRRLEKRIRQEMTLNQTGPLF